MSNNKLTEIEHLVLHGKYQQALKILNSVEKKRTITDDEMLMKLYLMIFVHLDKGEFQKGRDLADEMLKISKEQNNKLRMIDSYIGKTENTICLSFYEESSNTIQIAEKLLEKLEDETLQEYKHRKAYLKFLKARIYQDSHEIIKATELFEQSYELRKQINDKFGMLFTLLNWGISTTAIGDFKTGEKYLNKSLNIAKELNNEIGIIWNIVYSGWIKYHLGDLDTAISHAKEGLSICEPKNLDYSITHCYDLLGNCYLVKGDLKKALSYFERNLEFRLKQGYNNLITQSYYSIGNVYYQKGELKRSLSYYNKILKSPEVKEDTISKPTYLSTIGKIYGELGDFETAKKFLLEALDLLRKRKIFIYHYLNFDISIAKTIHYLIVLSVNNNDFENLNHLLEELHKLSDQFPKFKQIRQLYRLDKAIILKSSNRLMDKMEAWTIFKGIAEEDINDHQITIEAMTNLCELLIYELELTGNNSLLKNIEELSDELLIIAKSQYLYNLMVETYFFKAKLSLLNLNIKDARLLLTKAQKIAKDHDLNRLAKKISNEHDSLLVHIDDWEEMIRKKIPLQERVNYSRHEFLFSKMIRSKIERTPIEKDIPVYIVILYPYDGRCLYSKAFQDISINDGNLIASFISAINLFGKEALSSSGSIDRIKHGDFLIILQPKEKLLFGYVFKGQSYFAKTKLDNFIEFLLNSTNCFKVLEESIHNHLEISEETRLEIEKIVQQIILKN